MQPKLQKLRIALVHDVLTRPGGSINVLRQLLKLFPDADLYTSIDEDNPLLSDVRKNLVMTWRCPPIINKYSFFSKLLIRNYWESLNFDNYDLVISSSDEFSSKSIITKPETLHVSICYTPTRYLYSEYPYLEETNWIADLKRKFLLGLIRKHDFISAARPDVIISISKTVQKRVKKYYRRSSTLIYPPVEIPKKAPNRRVIDNYYIYTGSLESRKGLAIAVAAFNRLRKTFVIVGDGPEKEVLSQKARKNIIFTGYLSEAQKKKYLQKARGFVFPSIDEDFGIAPVEAMSCGVPVIAFKSGGPTETVANNKTGILFDEHTEASLTEAVLRFEKIKFAPIVCFRTAQRFSEDKFNKSLIQLLRKNLAKVKTIGHENFTD